MKQKPLNNVKFILLQKYMQKYVNRRKFAKLHKSELKTRNNVKI